MNFLIRIRLYGFKGCDEKKLNEFFKRLSNAFPEILAYHSSSYDITNDSYIEIKIICLLYYPEKRKIFNRIISEYFNYNLSFAHKYQAIVYSNEK